MGKFVNDIAELEKKAKASFGENKKFFRRLSSADKRKLDDLVHAAHDKVFQEIDCLNCGNCCRSLGPRITEADITKMAITLKLKPQQVVKDYLQQDEDGDWVFQKMPCPFLGEDNYCSIYPERPRACREYPHTDRRRFYQLLPITLKNSFICPAVFEIIELLKKNSGLTG